MKPLALQKTNVGNDFDDWSAFGALPGELADHCSREGATELKKKIEAYWRDRGFDVMVVLHNVGFHAAIRAARYDVRSDMVNGLPRRRPAAAAPQEVFVDDFDIDDADLSFE